MSKEKSANTNKSKAKSARLNASIQVGKGGELHQQLDGAHVALTTNQGVALSDNQNSLRANSRGPTLLEDFILREKITHFDHERIPDYRSRSCDWGAWLLRIDGFFEAFHHR